jgi:hypothetical protein
MKRFEMKGSIFAAVLLALMTSGLALAQDQPQSASLTPASSVARPAAKSLTVFGKVSGDGRSLVTDIDTEWTISNPEILKGHEATLVTVKCYVNPERNQLRVLSVKTAQPEFKFVSRSGDSAFRR